MAPSDIYAQQLLQLGKGYALWDAEPHNEPAVEIADVGYVENGTFVRLFNCSKPRGDLSNKFGVPESYQPLSVGAIREGTLSASLPLKSESVVHIEAEVALSAGSIVQAGASFSFECTKERGAVLVLGDDADRRDALHKHAFLKYILENYATWLAFANDAHERGIYLSDLVLVSGCDKTSIWANAAFSGNSSKIGVQLQVGNMGIAQGGLSVRGSWDDCYSVEAHSGPRSLTSSTTPNAAEVPLLGETGTLSSDHPHDSRSNSYPSSAEHNDQWSPILTHLLQIYFLLALMLRRAWQHLSDSALFQELDREIGGHRREPNSWEDDTVVSNRISPRDTERDLSNGKNITQLNTDPPQLPHLPRNQCVFLRGYKVCDRRSALQRLRRLGRKKKPQDDGFIHVPQKKDDKEDPGPGPNRALDSHPPWNGGIGSYQSNSSGNEDAKGGGSTGGNGSVNTNPTDEHTTHGESSCSFEDNSLDVNLSDLEANLDLYMELNQTKGHSPLIAIMDYILENSGAELALAHDDDLMNLFEGRGNIANIEAWISKVAPRIYITNQVGMLESTYHASLSIDVVPKQLSILSSTQISSRFGLERSIVLSESEVRSVSDAVSHTPAQFRTDSITIHDPSDLEESLSGKEQKRHALQELRRRWNCGVSEHGICLLSSDKKHCHLPDDDSAVWVEAICRGEATISEPPDGFLSFEDRWLMMTADADTPSCGAEATISKPPVDFLSLGDRWLTSADDAKTDSSRDSDTSSFTFSEYVETADSTESIDIPSQNHLPLEIDINEVKWTDTDLAEVCEPTCDTDSTQKRSRVQSPPSALTKLSISLAEEQSQAKQDHSKISLPYVDPFYAEFSEDILGNWMLGGKNELWEGLASDQSPSKWEVGFMPVDMLKKENAHSHEAQDIDITEFPWAVSGI